MSRELRYLRFALATCWAALVWVACSREPQPAQTSPEWIGAPLPACPACERQQRAHKLCKGKPLERMACRERNGLL